MQPINVLPALPVCMDWLVATGCVQHRTRTFTSPFLVQLATYISAATFLANASILMLYR
jgi:hypothetical protein